MSASGYITRHTYISCQISWHLLIWKPAISIKTFEFDMWINKHQVQTLVIITEDAVWEEIGAEDSRDMCSKICHKIGIIMHACMLVRENILVVIFTTPSTRLIISWASMYVLVHAQHS